MTDVGAMIWNAISSSVVVGMVVVSEPLVTDTLLVESIVPAVEFHHCTVYVLFASPVTLRVLPEIVPVIQPKVT